MKPVIFDSSAIIAALMGEVGGDRARLAFVESAVSSVNLAEVAGYLARKGGSREAIHAVLEPLPIEIVPFDAGLAMAAGMLVTATRDIGLSLGDRACLALAASRNARVVTADRAWLGIDARLGFDIDLIR